MVLTWDLMLAMDISILHGGLGAKLTVTGFGSENGSKHTFEVILKLGVPLLDAFPLGVMDAVHSCLMLNDINKLTML